MQIKPKKLITNKEAFTVPSLEQKKQIEKQIKPAIQQAPTFASTPAAVTAQVDKVRKPLISKLKNKMPTRVGM